MQRRLGFHRPGSLSFLRGAAGRRHLYSGHPWRNQWNSNIDQDFPSQAVFQSLQRRSVRVIRDGQDYHIARIHRFIVYHTHHSFSRLTGQPARAVPPRLLAPFLPDASQ